MEQELLTLQISFEELQEEHKLTTQNLKRANTKAELLEKHIQTLERDCDLWEKKYEEMTYLYKKSQKELRDLEEAGMTEL